MVASTSGNIPLNPLVKKSSKKIPITILLVLLAMLGGGVFAYNSYIAKPKIETPSINTDSNSVPSPTENQTLNSVKDQEQKLVEGNLVNIGYFMGAYRANSKENSVPASFDNLCKNGIIDTSFEQNFFKQDFSKLVSSILLATEVTTQQQINLHCFSSSTKYAIDMVLPSEKIKLCIDTTNQIPIKDAGVDESTVSCKLLQSSSNSISGQGTILVDTRPSSSPNSSQTLSTSLVSKTGESTQYPIDIKINNSKTFTSFADGSTNTFFWNAPWATSCVINSNVGPQGFVENTGTKQFTINFQGSDYPRELQISCNVGSHNSDVKINFAATPPALPNFLFTFPTTGSNIIRTISGSGNSKIITPQEVTIRWTPQLKSLRLSLHDSATGQKIQDFALPVRFTDVSGNSTVWTLSGVKDGKYYIRVDAINFIETNLRSVDFTVQTKQSTQ